MKNLIPLVKFLSDKDISTLLEYSKKADWIEHYSTKTGIKTPLEFTPITKRTITSPDEFKSELELTRQRGYSLDDREGGDNLLCIGAPIFDHSGKVISSISASGFYRKDIDLDYEVSVVKQAAHMISTRLGYK